MSPAGWPPSAEARMHPTAPRPWLYLPGRGRFVHSLVPRPGFEQAGKVEGRALVIKSGEETIALQCAGRITSETYIVYVRRDRDWRRDPAPKSGDPLLGALDTAEFKSDQ